MTLPYGPVGASGRKWRLLRSAAAVSPGGAVFALILLATLLRLLIAAATGLGIDESYMVSAGREFSLGYYDHPPLSWWLAGAASHLAGSESPAVVRLPFIALAAASGWLMFKLTAELRSITAGAWAAALFTLCPLFGFVDGTWVLPDGPLVCALLASALCLVRALGAGERGARSWWLGAGVAGGLALLSKYTAILPGVGFAAYLVTEPAHRHWLRRPEPYGAALLAAVIFAPVIGWNAAHGWASFTFQGGRAAAARFHPLAPLTVLGGQAVFMLPWIWAAMMLTLGRALRRGSADPAGWFCACLSLPPIVLFAVVALWSAKPVLFHWAAPGYLFLFPPLGDLVHRAASRNARWVRPCVIGTLLFLAAGLGLFTTEVRFNWLPDVLEDFPYGMDPDLNAVDWTSLRRDLDHRGLLEGRDVVVAALNWHDAGKIDYALHGAVPVICLNPDDREYGVIRPPTLYLGQDILLLAPARDAAKAAGRVRGLFQSVDELPPLILRHAGQPAMDILVFRGHRLRAPQ